MLLLIQLCVEISSGRSIHMAMAATWHPSDAPEGVLAFGRNFHETVSEVRHQTAIAACRHPREQTTEDTCRLRNFP